MPEVPLPHHFVITAPSIIAQGNYSPNVMRFTTMFSYVVLPPKHAFLIYIL